MEEQKITADQVESEAPILQNEDQDSDLKVDEGELIRDTKLIEEDIKAKFERYSELTKDIPKLKQLKEDMQPCELQIQDDLDKISSDLEIEFDPANVSKIIKKGRQQLGDKKSEYDKKNQDLEAALRLLKQEDKVISQRNESYSQLVNNTEGLRRELIKKQKEATDLMADCDTDKEKFATKYAKYKKEKKELENIEKKVLIRMSKQEGIVETCSDLIKKYKSQSKEANQKEDSKQANGKPLDLIADSIFKDTSEVQDRCETIKIYITKMITNKNEEIQNAKEDSNQQKKKVDQKQIEFNNSMNEVEASLKTISQNVEAINKYIKDCNDCQLSQRIDATYDFTKLILEPFKNIQTQDHDLKQPKFSLKEIDKAKQVRETEFKALAEVQSDLRELMLQGERVSQVRAKMQDKFSQIESTRKTIQELEDNINGWNSKLEKKKKEKDNLETEIEQNENCILCTLEDNFNKFCTSEQEKSQKEIYETILRNNEIREKKEKFYEQLIEQESKLASLNTRLEEMKKKDYSKLLTDFISYIFAFTTDSGMDKSKYGYAIVSEFKIKYYYMLKHYSKNKISQKNKKDWSQNINISFKDVIEIFKDCEYDFKSDLEIIKEKTENDPASQEQRFYFNFCLPLREFFECKNIEADIEKQKEIVEQKREELKCCKFEMIYSLQIKPKKEDLNKGVKELKTQKQSKIEKLTKLNQCIQNLENNISYNQSEIETQQSIKEKAKKEYAELKDYHNQVDSIIDGIIKKISDYSSFKLQDKSLKKEIMSDLSKVKEGNFKNKNIDNWINQILIEYINLFDEAYSKSVNEYKLSFEDHAKEVEQHYQSQIKGFKQDAWMLINQGCIEMDAVNQKNITKFEETSKQVGIILENISKASKEIQDQDTLTVKSIKKVSDISESIKQKSISDIVDEAQWDLLSKKIGELIQKSIDNKTAVENLFIHLEDEVKRNQDVFNSNKETLEQTKKNIDAKVIKLTKLKGIGEYKDRNPGKDGVLNREQIKSKITEVNKTIQEFNKNIEKYEQKLNECIQSKQKLNNLEVQLQAKKNKIQEMQDNHTDVIANLKKKEKEFKYLEDEINKMNVLSIKYKNCEIIVRKNELINELTEAIVNPTDERYTDNIGISKKVANNEGDMNRGENKELVKIHGRLHEGQATMTNINNLPCQSVIHAFSPKYNKKNNSLLKSGIKAIIIKILDIVISNEFDSVSIPEISTEANNIPINLSAPIICKTIKSFINSNREEMKGKTIVLCCPHRLSTEFLKNIVNKHFKDRKDRSDGDEEEQKGEESDQSFQICRSCSKEITENKHQTKGKHLSICYRCYKKKKEGKDKKRKEQEQDDEDSEEEINTKKKRKSIKKRDSSISSEESKERKLSKKKSSKSSNKNKSYQDDESNEDFGRDKKKKKNRESDEDSEREIKKKKKKESDQNSERDKKKKRGKKKKISSDEENGEGEEDTIKFFKRNEVIRKEGIMSDNEEDSM